MMRIDNGYARIRQQENNRQNRRVEKQSYRIVRRDLHREKQHLIYKVSALLLCTILLLVVMVCATTSDAQDGLTTPRIKYYTSIEIQPGDSLWALCQEYMSEEYAAPSEYIEEVRQLNHLIDDSITAGGYLVLPYYSSEIMEDP